MSKVSKIRVKNTLASAEANYYQKNKKKRSKHAKEIKGLLWILWIEYYIQIRLSSQNIINSDKDIALCFDDFFRRGAINVSYPIGCPSGRISRVARFVEEPRMSIMDRFQPLTEADITQPTPSSTDFPRNLHPAYVTYAPLSEQRSDKFEPRPGHSWRLFHLWLRFVAFGRRSARLDKSSVTKVVNKSLIRRALFMK